MKNSILVVLALWGCFLIRDSECGIFDGSALGRILSNFRYGSTHPHNLPVYAHAHGHDEGHGDHYGAHSHHHHPQHIHAHPHAHAHAHPHHHHAEPQKEIHRYHVHVHHINKHNVHQHNIHKHTKHVKETQNHHIHQKLIEKPIIHHYHEEQVKVIPYHKYEQQVVPHQEKKVYLHKYVEKHQPIVENHGTVPEGHLAGLVGGQGGHAGGHAVTQVAALPSQYGQYAALSSHGQYAAVAVPSSHGYEHKGAEQSYGGFIPVQGLQGIQGLPQGYQAYAVQAAPVYAPATSYGSAAISHDNHHNSHNEYAISHSQPHSQVVASPAQWSTYTGPGSEHESQKLSIVEKKDDGSGFKEYQGTSNGLKFVVKVPENMSLQTLQSGNYGLAPVYADKSSSSEENKQGKIVVTMKV